MNGNVDLQSGNTNSSGTPHQKPIHDYKLLVDPCLVKAPQKIYRYNGIVPNDSQYPPVIVKDPRNVKAIKIRIRVDPMEMPVPR